MTGKPKTDSKGCGACARRPTRSLCNPEGHLLSGQMQNQLSGLGRPSHVSVVRSLPSYEGSGGKAAKKVEEEDSGNWEEARPERSVEWEMNRVAWEVIW